MNLKKLPIGELSFENLINENRIYVDKTEKLYNLILVNLLKERNFYLPRAEDLLVEESIFSSYELDDLNPESLLLQTGYLTIKNYDFETNEYILSYPNKEVKYSFLKI